MTYVWFLQSALADVRNAYSWYERERSGLGEEFVLALEDGIDRIREYPFANPPVHRDARRYLVTRFPYCLYYRVVGDGLIVVALLHAARDPELPERRVIE